MEKSRFDQITEWLKSSQNYFTGVRLFESLGDDKKTLEILRRGNFPANRKLLASKMKNLADQVKPGTVPETETETKPEPAKDKGKTSLAVSSGLRKKYPNIKLEEAPEEIKLLFTEAISTFNKALEGHEDLFNAETDDEGFDAAEKAVESMIENSDVHAELQHFNDTGKVLGKHPIVVQTKFREQCQALIKKGKAGILELDKKREAAYNSYTRHKKFIEDNPDDPNLPRKKELMNEHLYKMTFIENLLGLKNG